MLEYQTDPGAPKFRSDQMRQSCRFVAGAKADAEFALIEAKLTQAELAEKVGTPQVVTSGESSHKKTLITLRLFHFYI